MNIIESYLDNVQGKTKLDIELGVTYEEKFGLPNDMIIEPKYDGVRSTIIIKDDVKVIGRRGLRQPHVEKLLQGLTHPTGIIIDTESYYKTWNQTVSIVKTGKGIKNLRLYCFDVFSIDEYKKRHTKKLLKDRKKDLKSIINKFKNPYLIDVPYKKVDNMQQIMKIYKEYLKKYEGAMVKDFNAYYSFKRTKDWLKFKEVDELTVTCIGVKEGSGKNKGRLGALIVVDSKGNKYNVGVGYTDKQRDELWKNRPIGLKIDIVMGKSKTKITIANVPVFIRVRADLPKEIIQEKLYSEVDAKKATNKQLLDDHRIFHAWWMYIKKTGKNMKDRKTNKIIDKKEIAKRHNIAVKEMFKRKFKHNWVSDLDDTLTEDLKRKTKK